MMRDLPPESFFVFHCFEGQHEKKNKNDTDSTATLLPWKLGSKVG